MRAEVGDEILVESHQVGGPQRKGEVLEVKGERGHEHFVVRWDDGHESTFFPSSDASVVHVKKSGGSEA